MKNKKLNSIIEAQSSGSHIFPNGTLSPNSGLYGKQNNNWLVVGASGSYKTRGVVLPNVLSGGGGSSMIISDTKGMLYDTCAPRLRGLGYKAVLK